MWRNNYSVEEINAMCDGTIHDALGIVITEKNTDSLVATMAVDERTFQPMRILHGGANVVLAESLGSIASLMMINRDKYYSVGLDINANHLRSAKGGRVKGIVKAISIGRKVHVWEIKIYDEREKLSCISRLTVAVLEIAE